MNLDRAVSASAQMRERLSPWKRWRVLLAPGGGYGFPAVIGALEAARAHDLSIDAVVGTCGGSVAASILNLVPNYPDQVSALLSEKMWRFQEVRFNEVNARGDQLVYLLVHLITDYLHQQPHEFAQAANWLHQVTNPPTIARRMQILATWFLVDIDLYPVSPVPDLERPFSASKPHAVVVAYDLEMATGRLTETLFTDPEAATRLQNYRCPMPGFFPEGPINPNVEIITTAPAHQAAEASMMDQMVFRPSPRKLSPDPPFLPSHLWSGGTINLAAVEVALALASNGTGVGGEVIVLQRLPYTGLVPDLIANFMARFRPNVRLNYVLGHPGISRYVDFTDEAEILGPSMPTPIPRYDRTQIKNRTLRSIADQVWTLVQNRDRIGISEVVTALRLLAQLTALPNVEADAYPEIAAAFQLDPPSHPSYAAYRKQTLHRIRYGYSRMSETLRMPRGPATPPPTGDDNPIPECLRHIRKIDRLWRR